MLALTENLRNQHLNNIRDAIDAGSSPGVIRIYAGTRPSPGEAASGALLGECVFSSPSAPDAEGGVLTFNSVTEDSEAPTSGTASWVRVQDGDGTWVMDMDVGTQGSGAPFEINTLDIVEGGPVRVNNAVLSAGNE